MMTYPTIKIKLIQTQELVYGSLIGVSLVVYKANRTSWAIANKQGAILFSNISSDNDAKEIASFLNETYSEYFVLWREYPEMDIFDVTKWTVPEGLRLFETIEQLRISPIINVDIMHTLFTKATGQKYYWFYMKEVQNVGY